MPYVVFIKAANLDYLRYKQYNESQRMSKMRAVCCFFPNLIFFCKKIHNLFYRKVLLAIIHH